MAKMKARTKNGEVPGHSAARKARAKKRAAKRAVVGTLEGKKFSELDAGEKDTLLRLLGEMFKLIEEE